MRPVLLLLCAIGCQRAEARPEPPAAAPTLRIDPDGKPDCNFVIDIPPLETLQASVDKTGVVHLVAGIYIELPVSSSVAMSGKDLHVDLHSAGPNQNFCVVPLKVTGAPKGPLPITMDVHHGGRPKTELRASVVVP